MSGFIDLITFVVSIDRNRAEQEADLGTTVMDLKRDLIIQES